MDYHVKTGDPTGQASACLVVASHAARKLPAVAQAVDLATQGALRRQLARAGFDGTVGKTQMLQELPGIAAQRVLAVGLGDARKLDAKALRKAFGAAGRALAAGNVGDALVTLTAEPTGLPIRDVARDLVTAFDETVYRFDQLKSKPTPPKVPLTRVGLLAADRSAGSALRRGIAEGEAIAVGARLARDLGNLPGNICTPTYLAAEARRVARSQRKLRVEVLEQKDMERLGMGALLSVARGSRQPPKLIVMHYRGAPARTPPLVLIGKGLTFDAGGISLKPAADMDQMKYDMCGGAAVIGTIAACVRLDLPLNVVGVVPSSENLPDGNANKPGDVVTSMSGQTIEVLNTDAEGRLILCDALTYSERFKPAAVVDVATLPGACVGARAHHASGLFTTDETLAAELLAAGEKSGDRCWRMPLWDDFQDQLDSNFADMANIGGKSAGAIIGACFLGRYAKAFPWAHLDVAGTAWRTGNDKGATGRPVALLTHWLLQRAGMVG
jgi:leucyl aminopeptidase